jgi:hypothetical protein
MQDKQQIVDESEYLMTIYSNVWLTIQNTSQKSLLLSRAYLPANGFSNQPYLFLERKTMYPITTSITKSVK